MCVCVCVCVCMCVWSCVHKYQCLMGGSGSNITERGRVIERELDTTYHERVTHLLSSIMCMSLSRRVGLKLRKSPSIISRGYRTVWTSSMSDCGQPWTGEWRGRWVGERLKEERERERERKKERERDVHQWKIIVWLNYNIFSVSIPDNIVNTQARC